jgi:hypothetical protein
MSKISDNQSDGSYQNTVEGLGAIKKNAKNLEKFRHTKQGTNNGEYSDLRVEANSKKQHFASDAEETYSNNGGPGPQQTQ